MRLTIAVARSRVRRRESLRGESYSLADISIPIDNFNESHDHKLLVRDDRRKEVSGYL
jgi:hypothetical protein